MDQIHVQAQQFVCPHPVVNLDRSQMQQTYILDSFYRSPYAILSTHGTRNSEPNKKRPAARIRVVLW